MEMKLYSGSPEDESGREERETRVYDLLDSLGIEYTRTDHGHADTMEACNEIDAILGVLICKNLFLCNRQKTSFYLLMMPGDKPFRTKEFSAALGISRVSFATPEDMERLLGLLPGSVSIMGLMNDTQGEVQLVIDRDVIAGEHIGCHPCVNTSSLKLKTTDIIEKFLPAVKHTPFYVELTGEG